MKRPRPQYIDIVLPVSLFEQVTRVDFPRGLPERTGISPQVIKRLLRRATTPTTTTTGI